MKSMSIKLSTNMVIQVLGGVSTVSALLSAQNQLIHGQTALIIVCIGSVAQGLSAYIGHLSNPDGTRAIRGK